MLCFFPSISTYCMWSLLPTTLNILFRYAGEVVWKCLYRVASSRIQLITSGAIDGPPNYFTYEQYSRCILNISKWGYRRCSLKFPRFSILFQCWNFKHEPRMAIRYRKFERQINKRSGKRILSLKGRWDRKCTFIMRPFYFWVETSRMPVKSLVRTLQMA